MSANAAGIRKLVNFALESDWNIASMDDGQLLRRVTSTLDEVKDTYKSNELRPSYQKSDMRHGTVRVAGSINGEISPGTYSLFMAEACRKDFASGATTGAITTLSSSASSPHFADSGNGLLTAGFKIGDIVRVAGFTSAGAPNNARNYIIATGLTAGVMPVHDLGKTTGTVATMTAGDTVTISVVNKKTLAPLTGHTDQSFSIEHWFSDTGKSELFTGCKTDTLAMSFKPGAMATIALAMKGGGMTPGTSQYFDSAAAATSSGILAGVNGGLLLAGSESVYVTGLDISLAAGLSDDPVIGTNAIQEIVRGVIEGSGTLMAKFPDTTIRDYFLNESEISLIFYMTTSNALTADFVQVCLPRIKFTDAKKSDGPKGIIQTLPFVALENVNGGSGQTSEHTTISFQDSLA